MRIVKVLGNGGGAVGTELNEMRAASAGANTVALSPAAHRPMLLKYASRWAILTPVLSGWFAQASTSASSAQPHR